MCHAARWRLAGIDYLDFNNKRVAAVVRDDPGAFDTKIGSQLALGGDLGALYEPPGRPPQGNSGEEQQTGESHQKRVGDLESVAVQRRPELGSLLGVTCGL